MSGAMNGDQKQQIRGNMLLVLNKYLYKNKYITEEENRQMMGEIYKKYNLHN